MHLLHRAAVVLAIATLGLTTACSEDDERVPESAASSDAEGTQRADPLEAGLQAHVEGRLDEASEQYERVLDRDPKDKFALYNLALIAQQQDELDEAVAGYRDVLDIDDAYGPALYNLAILLEKEDEKEAVSLYRRAIEATPEDARPKFRLGLLLRRSGDTSEGDRLVEEAIRMNPDLRDEVPEP